MKKGKNSYCLCALTFLRDDDKTFKRRASLVMHAVARTSVWYQMARFVVVCDIPRAVSTRDGAGFTSDWDDDFGQNYRCLHIRFV